MKDRKRTIPVSKSANNIHDLQQKTIQQLENKRQQLEAYIQSIDKEFKSDLYNNIKEGNYTEAILTLKTMIDYMISKYKPKVDIDTFFMNEVYNNLSRDDEICILN